MRLQVGVSEQREKRFCLFILIKLHSACLSVTLLSSPPPKSTSVSLRLCCVCLCVFGRFRAGFKQAFRWCPCIHADAYEGLELKSTRYLQTQTSVYKTSRAEPSVPVVNSPSLELASNGSSSRSMSKTVSETSSFYCGNNLPA